MPGLVGLLTSKPSGNEASLLQAMLDAMLHETFYRHGSYACAENNCFIGYVAIRDSFADCMPIFNEKRDIILFLTGEVYADKGVASELRTHGHEFSPDNASYLVHQYEEKGEDFFQELNGWFNGVLVDLRASRVILFNDRYGIRRLYLHEYADGLAFASEAKSLLRIFPELRSMDLQAVGEFLNFDCVLENRTFFPGVSLLPAGSAWTYEKGHLQKRSYLDWAALEGQTPLRRADFLEELGGTFKRVLPRYLSGGKAGLSLTGGLDTRCILACLNIGPGELPCYTFGGTYRDILDVRLAPKVASVCGQPHQTLRIEDEQLLKDYPYLVERSIYISDGQEGVDKADVLRFNQMARGIAPIRLTGKYGSQMLKGIVGFQARPPEVGILSEEFRPYLDTAQMKYSELRGGNPLTFLCSCAIPWWWNGFVALEASQLAVRSPFLDNELHNLLYRVPKDLGDFGAEFELGLIARHKPELMSIPTTGSYGGNLPWGLSSAVKAALKWILTLDKIHMREALPYGMTHLVGRLDYRLSPLRLDRLVMGFGEFRRYRTWFRDQLAGYVQDLLLSDRAKSRPYWKQSYLRKVVEDHIHGRGTYLREIRKALQVELIHRVLLEAPN